MLEKPQLQDEERYQCGEIVVKNFRSLSGRFDLRSMFLSDLSGRSRRSRRLNAYRGVRWESTQKLHRKPVLRCCSQHIDTLLVSRRLARPKSFRRADMRGNSVTGTLWLRILVVNEAASTLSNLDDSIRFDFVPCFPLPIGPTDD